MKHKRRNPLPVRQHRKRGIAPAPGLSPAIVEAKRRLDERLQATLSALRIEHARSQTDTPGEALRSLAELWKTTYADG
ncbi:hypothetical protein [Caulobacter hibisci]|uniref:Uncharacterized protein n=1 Tax=Caulobacter hibisci TaxID=2035993 RepID=A0ABS0T7G1_9CAUL|nr:hypothetical protein [Caulobacter hibisci]MBI1686818.1 hypothetical protein [Caulobacter hibisci]